MSLTKKFGPFEVVASTHQEDYALKTVKVKAVEAGGARVELEEVVDGKARELADVAVSRQGAKLMVDGRELSFYVGDRRVTAAALRPGLEIVLAEQRVFGPPELPENLRLPHVRHEPFLSSLPLDERFKRGGKYRRHSDRDAERSELDKLRRENAELRARIDADERREARGEQPHQGQQSRPAQQDKRQPVGAK